MSEYIIIMYLRLFSFNKINMNMNKIILISELLLITIFGFGQQKNFIDENYIEVAGSAEMEVVPDEIYLQVSIREKDDREKETLEELEKKMFVQLTKAGVDVEKDVSISNMMSSLQYRWLRKDNINAQKNYQILARDAVTVEKIYQLLNEIEISNISIVSMNHSKIEEFRRTVKINALKAAKEKASDLAEAIGQKVGKAIHITETPENHYGFINQSVVANMLVEQESMEDKVQVEFEKIKIRYTMGAKFKLE